MKKFLYLSITVGLLLFSCNTNSRTEKGLNSTGSKVCIIEGKVIDRPDSKVVYIAPERTDFRVSNEYDIIEISKDGTFTDTIRFEHSRLFSITFEEEYKNSSWLPIDFMLEDGIINVEVYPSEDSDKNIITGGELNKRYNYLKYEPRKLFSTSELIQDHNEIDFPEQFFSKEGLENYNRINEARSDDQIRLAYKEQRELEQQGRLYSAKTMSINKKIDSVYNLQNTWALNQILKEEADPAALAILRSDVRTLVLQDKSIDEHLKVFNKKFSDGFNKNPMKIELMRDIAALKIKAGNPYPDFSAPDLEGNMLTLSEEIKGKVAVIDLWASWCGPCIRTSKSFIPVWEKYKDKGFTIIGVARELDNTKAMEAAIEKHKFPWINLVELNDRLNIWAKYGAGSGGGKVILVDKDGRIVDVEFDAEALEGHLERLLP